MSKINCEVLDYESHACQSPVAARVASSLGKSDKLSKKVFERLGKARESQASKTSNYGNCQMFRNSFNFAVPATSADVQSAEFHLREQPTVGFLRIAIWRRDSSTYLLHSS